MVARHWQDRRDTGDTRAGYGRDTGGTPAGHGRDTGGTRAGHRRDTGGTPAGHGRDTGRDTSERPAGHHPRPAGHLNATGRTPPAAGRTLDLGANTSYHDFREKLVITSKKHEIILGKHF